MYNLNEALHSFFIACLPYEATSAFSLLDSPEVCYCEFGEIMLIAVVGEEMHMLEVGVRKVLWLEQLRTRLGAWL